MTENSSAASARPQLPPDAQLLQLICGAFISQAVYVAAKLGIADLLADGPKHVDQLAERTSTHSRSLYRLLRSLASVGTFTEIEGKVFSNTPMSETMRSDIDRSTRDLAIWIGEEPHWRVYGHLLYSVQTGKAAWDKVLGEPVFPYLFNTDKELGQIFNQAMTSLSHQSIGAVLATYDFSGANTIADIAGGFGHLLAAILQKNSGANGILFDLPAPLAGATQMFESYGVTDRVELVEGDFFKEVPVKADIYLLKHIIHDWYEDNCEKILRNIHASMPDDARVLIIEAVIPDGNDPNLGKIIDLEMLLSPGGVERTQVEFAELLSAAGFRLNRVIPTPGPMSIIEAVKAQIFPIEK